MIFISSKYNLYNYKKFMELKKVHFYLIIFDKINTQTAMQLAIKMKNTTIIKLLKKHR